MHHFAYFAFFSTKVAAKQMRYCVYVVSVAVGSRSWGRPATVTPNIVAVQAERMQSKQNHICAL